MHLRATVDLSCCRLNEWEKLRVHECVRDTHFTGTKTQDFHHGGAGSGHFAGLKLGLFIKRFRPETKKRRKHQKSSPGIENREQRRHRKHFKRGEESLTTTFYSWRTQSVKFSFIFKIFLFLHFLLWIYFLTEFNGCYQNINKKTSFKFIKIYIIQCLFKLNTNFQHKLINQNINSPADYFKLVYIQSLIFRTLLFFKLVCSFFFNFCRYDHLKRRTEESGILYPVILCGSSAQNNPDLLWQRTDSAGIKCKRSQLLLKRFTNIFPIRSANINILIQSLIRIFLSLE